VFLRARYYGTQSGAFFSSDIWGGDSTISASLNKWTYALSNPNNYFDKDGRRPSSELTYEVDDPQPEIFTYDETIPPANIQFIGTELSADRMSWHECIFTGNGIACYLHPKMKGDSGWQYFNGNTGLCGEISLAAILIGALDKNIDIHDMVLRWKKYMAGVDPDPNYTQPDHFARFINLAYGEILHAWYEEADSRWLTASTWRKGKKWVDPKENIISLLQDEWFAQNTYVMAMIKIDPTANGKGRLSWGVEELYGKARNKFGDRWVSKYVDKEGIQHEDPCTHWVVITGVSVEWDNPWGGTWDNPWQWVRVFNPFRGISEYYWWRDFHDSWTGQMIRVDRADAANTCDMFGNGQCTTPSIAGVYNTIERWNK